MKKAFFLLVSVLTLTACVQLVEGEGDVITREYNLKDFKGVIMDVAGKLSVTQGEKNISVTTNKNLFEWLNLYVSDSVLHIYLQDKVKIWEFDELRFDVSLPSPDYIGLNGSGDIEVSDSLLLKNEIKIEVNGSGDVVAKKIVAGSINFMIDGAGNIRCDEVSSNAVFSDISGSGDIRLTGTTDFYDVIIDGAGSVLSFDMTSQNAVIQIGGAGDCQLTVEDSLAVDIDGSGSVYYKGDPETDITIDGTGSVQKVGS